jgi:hypothetical protein
MSLYCLLLIAIITSSAITGTLGLRCDPKPTGIYCYNNKEYTSLCAAYTAYWGKVHGPKSDPSIKPPPFRFYNGSCRPGVNYNDDEEIENFWDNYESGRTGGMEKM